MSLHERDRTAGASSANSVIITCAVTGSIYTPTMSPYLPITADDIVRASVEAAQAGAAIIHLHARHPKTGAPSADPAHFEAFLPRIKAGTDAILNISTGGSSLMPLDVRLGPARAFRPEMCSLNMGSMNFGTFPLLERHDVWTHDWEPKLLDATRRVVFQNTFEDIETILRDIGEAGGAKFEFECYDLGQVETLGFYLRKGLVKPPVFVQFVLGVMGGAGAQVESLIALKAAADRVLGPSYEFSVLAAGAKQMRLASVGAVMGGHVRVGLEDNLAIAPGRLASSNAEQVAKIRGVLEELGYRIATADEARLRLGLAGVAAVGF